MERSRNGRDDLVIRLVHQSDLRHDNPGTQWSFRRQHCRDPVCFGRDQRLFQPSRYISCRSRSAVPVTFVDTCTLDLRNDMATWRYNGVSVSDSSSQMTCLAFSPLLGGTFSDPATKYPSFFDYALFRSYPYLFPCLVAAIISCAGATFGYFFMEEVRALKVGLAAAC